MRHLSKRGLAALIICATVVTSSLTFIFDSYGDGSSKTHSATFNPSVSPLAANSFVMDQNSGNILNLALNSGVPSKYIYLPNIYATNLAEQEVSPLYTRSPAPMGLTDYGFMEPSGMKIPYSYETSSFLGTVMFENLNAQYLMNSNPDSVAAQLSAVLSVPGDQGNNANYYWVKNVMLYTPATGEAQFVSNIWDISTPSMTLPAGSILSGNGTVIPGLMYYFAGPVVQLSGENTIGLYVNAVDIGGHNAVVFQYASGGGEHGEVPVGVTFDTVVLSSTTPEITGPPAKFVVDGFSKTPSGLLKDVELAITGPGMGSTSSIYNANGQLTLKFMGSDSTYTRLPAAYNYGSNTGETVQGLSVWWTSQMKPMGHLSTGPSLLVSLWGSQVSHSGAVNLQGWIEPGNAFVFISMGQKLDTNTAAWAPVNQNGSYKFSLPGRITYTMEVLASNHDPKFATIATETNDTSHEGTGQPHGGGGGGEGQDETLAWTNFTLEFNGSRGVYTPLYANGNDQLSLLAVGHSSNGTMTGNGTASDPYVLENNQYTRINELFTRTNNYLYPEFSGLLIENTNTSVRVDSPPSFQFKYPVEKYNLLNTLGLPYYNNLNMILYNTSKVTVLNSTSITGWFPGTMFNGIMANLMMVDSTDFLIASNTFSSMGSSLSIYSQPTDSGNGTVWGNTFERDVLIDSSYGYGMLHALNPMAISLFSSDNLLYNNYFGQGTDVVSPLHDPYSLQPDMYRNSWNLPEKQNVSYTNWVNGIALHGSIVNCGYQGGNYWEARDVGQIPFNADSRIAYGGDYIPLVQKTYNVSFNALGNIPPSGWTVQFDMKSKTHFMGQYGSHGLSNGTHQFRIITVPGYSASPSTGTIDMKGTGQTINITFTKVVYPVTFTRTGIDTGSSWSLSVGNFHKSTNEPSVTLYLENGSYQYSAIVKTKGQFAQSEGSFLVMGHSVDQVISFNNKLHEVNFVMNNGNFNGQWAISINGITYNSSSTSIASSLENGEYEYTVIAPTGYVVSPSSGSIFVLDGNVTIPLSVSLKTYTVTFVGKGMTSGTQWQIEFGDQTAYSTISEITFDVPAGNYTYNIPGISSYTSNQTNGYVLISDRNVTVNIEFQAPVDYSWSALTVLISTASFAAITTVTTYFVGRRK